MARDQAESHNVDGCWVIPVRGYALWEGSPLLSPADAEMVVASNGTWAEQPPCKGRLPTGRSSDSDPHAHPCRPKGMLCGPLGVALQRAGGWGGLGAGDGQVYRPLRA